LHASEDGIEASYKDGSLEIRVPKSEVNTSATKIDACLRLGEGGRKVILIVRRPSSAKEKLFYSLATLCASGAAQDEPLR